MSLMFRSAVGTLRKGYRQYSVKFPQSVEELESQNPKVGQFKNPLFHTFLIASSAYMTLHLVQLTLEHNEEQRRYMEEEKVLEADIQALMDHKKLQMSQRRWYHLFWKAS